MKVRCNSCFHLYDEALGLCPFCGHIEGEGPSKAFCLAPGTMISNRYIIGQVLGLGGFGIIYKAWDNKLNIELAIKEFYPTGLVNRTPGEAKIFLVSKKNEREFERRKDRFLEEARNTVKFSKHNNIVNVYGYFEANNTAYIVMEFLEGRTLSQAVHQQSEPLRYDYCISIAVDICAALRAIHKEGILHRDVSPDNIMLCSNGTVKLFDFGEARFSAGIESRVDIVVKPGFSPPEQYDQVNRQDARTDIYALGATLYYAMTGVTELEESVDRKREDKLEEPYKIESSIPKSISSIIMRAMAIEPQYRFPNVDAFEKALLSEKKQRSVKAERRRRKINRFFGISLSVVILLAAAALFLLDMRRQREENTLPNATITIYYKISSVSNDTLGQPLNSIIKEFTEEYSNVQVNAVGVNAEDYSRVIEEKASESGIIFESTGIDDSFLSDSLVITDLFTDSQMETYIRSEINTDKRFPSGIVCPIIFVRQSEELTDISLTFAEIKDISVHKEGTIVVSPEAYAMFSTAYEEEKISECYSLTAREDFVTGKASVFLGTSADYFSVQRAIPGQYKVAIPESVTATYVYGQQWSAVAKSPEEEKVEKAFLAYLNSALAQDYLHIQAQSGNLPILKEKENDYWDVYEELKILEDYLSKDYAVSLILDKPEISTVTDSAEGNR